MNKASSVIGCHVGLTAAMLAALLACSGGSDQSVRGAAALQAPDATDTTLAQTDSATEETLFMKDAGVLAGQAGSPCKQHGDCDSGLCVITSAGQKCTKTCTDGCADMGPSFVRKPVAGSSDLASYCLPSWPKLGDPRRDHALPAPPFDKLRAGSSAVA